MKIVEGLKKLRVIEKKMVQNVESVSRVNRDGYL